jgi:hypothetical protein
MKDMTWGTFISCMFLSFVIGFLACHKLYAGLGERHDFIDILGITTL